MHLSTYSSKREEKEQKEQKEKKQKEKEGRRTRGTAQPPCHETKGIEHHLERFPVLASFSAPEIGPSSLKVVTRVKLTKSWQDAEGAQIRSPRQSPGV